MRGAAGAMLAALVINAFATSPPRWVNTTNGIHAFLTFDSALQLENISKHGEAIDYVWGATEHNIKYWRASAQTSKVVLSKYIPYTRDPAPHLDKNQSGLPWWLLNHPDLVLYQCDRKTPAWECFSGEGCAHRSVPIDLTNPKTLDYQMEAAVLPAKHAGYNAIAFDNYGLRNTWKACGAFKGSGGAWVQMYSGEREDPQYTADVLDWTARVVARVHQEAMLVIPNFSPWGGTTDADVLRVTNLTDGLLAEAGFAEWNPVPNTSSYSTPPLKTSPSKFREQVLFVRNLQRHAKGFFAINEWGAGPDYHLNPEKIPFNISERFGVQNRAIRQFVVAAFMMVNGGSCGVHLTCIQCYGGAAGGVGGMSLWPEYSAPVGTPIGEPVENLSGQGLGVWIRFYTGAIALVNANHAARPFKLPAGTWVDLYQQPVGDSSVTLPPASGLVLLKNSS